MDLTIQILIVLIAIEHFYFLYLEMYLWTSKKGIEIFGLKSKEFAEQTKVLAANQGLYNGFLASGLLFSLLIESTKVDVFFLSCIAIAGIYGAYSTKNHRLFYFQSLPSIVTLLLIYLQTQS